MHRRSDRTRSPTPRCPPSSPTRIRSPSGPTTAAHAAAGTSVSPHSAHSSHRHSILARHPHLTSPTLLPFVLVLVCGRDQRQAQLHPGVARAQPPPLRQLAQRQATPPRLRGQPRRLLPARAGRRRHGGRAVQHPARRRRLDGLPRRQRAAGARPVRRRLRLRAVRPRHLRLRPTSCTTPRFGPSCYLCNLHHSARCDGQRTTPTSPSRRSTRCTAACTSSRSAPPSHSTSAASTSVLLSMANRTARPDARGDGVGGSRTRALPPPCSVMWRVSVDPLRACARRGRRCGIRITEPAGEVRCAARGRSLFTSSSATVTLSWGEGAIGVRQTQTTLASPVHVGAVAEQ